MTEPVWYKDAIFYELHVRSFQDGNNDGIGDFVGLTQRLDYLSDLGVTAVWLLPFYASPLKDDGYDISDYTSIHSDYGTLEDFRLFLDKAHSLGMRVITELVINHTSDQHPWFQRARNAPPGSVEREFYVWSDDTLRYAQASLMFPDYESSNWAWDPVANQYYWHRFYSHQPDLNFDNPAVCDAIPPVIDFWFEMGVDGMRLDAVPFLYEREGTNCEHLPETHKYLKLLRKHVDQRYPNRMFLAEANAWPDEMVEYFGQSDECHMAFHFPLMPRLYLALHQENRFPIVDILAQTPAIPDDCQWCLFLRNHDELTLAMVTEQERIAMYSAYTRERQAQLFMGIRHRLAPLMRNDRRRIELLNSILFSLPGTPVVYYGDEIGMGDNIYLGDRNGVRTPMQWSDDRNAGFSRANSQKLILPVIVDSEYHYEAVNVETQQNNPSSLLWWVKRLISMRKRHPAFGQGKQHILESENTRVLAYLRETDSERLLVVANLSRFVQSVQLDLTEYSDLIPEELFGRARFPKIRSSERYNLTLGPHEFYWFTLVPENAVDVPSEELPNLAIENWDDFHRTVIWDRFSRILASRYSAESETKVESCRLLDLTSVPFQSINLALLVCKFEYGTSADETIYQFLAIVPEELLDGQRERMKAISLARVGKSRNEILCDPIGLPLFGSELLRLLARNAETKVIAGKKLVCRSWETIQLPVAEESHEETVSIPIASGPLSCVVINRQWLLRRFRRADEGLNPDVEIGRVLQEKQFPGFARIAGTIELQRSGREPVVLAAIHHNEPNQSTGWHAMTDLALRFFEVCAAQSLSEMRPDQLPHDHQHLEPKDADDWEHLVTPFLTLSKSVAEFTGKLHKTLGEFPWSSNCAPQANDQRAFYQTIRTAAGRLHVRLGELGAGSDETVRELAAQVRSHYPVIQQIIRLSLDPDLATGSRIRCHGRYRLGRLLVSGTGCILTDFEGVKESPLAERRIKRTPMFDVATMISSFHYAVNAVRLELLDKSNVKLGLVREEDHARLRPYSHAWLARIQREFMEIYLSIMSATTLLPDSPAGCEKLLQLSLLKQAFRDAERDLSFRPTWAQIPLAVINAIIGRFRSNDVHGVA